MHPTVNMEMISKAAAAADRPAEPVGEVQKRTADHMISIGLDVTGDDLLLEAPVRVGSRALGLSIRLASDDEDAFEQAEIVVEAQCRYKDFEICTAEMREAQARAKDALSKAGMTPDKAFCVACKLKSLPRAKVMLESIDADMMSYSTPDGHTFDLYDNKIEYYDTEVHRGMMSFLKKMLVAHS